MSFMDRLNADELFAGELFISLLSIVIFLQMWFSYGYCLSFHRTDWLTATVWRTDTMTD